MITIKNIAIETIAIATSLPKEKASRHLGKAFGNPPIRGPHLVGDRGSLAAPAMPLAGSNGSGTSGEPRRESVEMGNPKYQSLQVYICRYMMIYVIYVYIYICVIMYVYV